MRGAVESGADAVGFIFAPSPRRIDPERARYLAAEVPAFVSIVGVFADPERGDLLAARDAVPRMLFQFHGSESPEFCEEHGGDRYIKAFHVRPRAAYSADDFSGMSAYAHALLLFDSKIDEREGGTGVPFDWQILKTLSPGRRLAISGGLTPQNVAECVRMVKPYAVDVRSGVERGSGKDRELMRSFIQSVRDADAEA